MRHFLTLVTVSLAASGLAGCSDFATGNGDATTDAASVLEAGGRDAPSPDASRDTGSHDATSPRDGLAPGEATTEAGGTDAAGDVHKGCVAASCGVEVMVDHLQQPLAVAVDGTYLYWLEQGVLGDAGAGGFGELARVPKAKPCLGSPCTYEVLDSEVLAGEGIYNSTMALGPGHVCFAQTFDSSFEYSVTCVALDDGTAQNVAQASGYVQGIWVGSSDVYWAVTGSMTGVADGVVTGATLDGGAPVALASNRPSPWAITGDGTNVFWTETGLDAGTGAVFQRRPDGGVTSLASGQASPQAIAVYDGYVYWADEASGTIQRVKPGPTASVETVAKNQQAPIALAVDPSGIYWANAGKPFQNDYEGGSVAHVTTPGGSVVVDVPNLTNLFGLALDAAYVYAVTAGTYAADYTDGSIVRAGKLE